MTQPWRWIVLALALLLGLSVLSLNVTPPTAQSDASHVATSMEKDQTPTIESDMTPTTTEVQEESVAIGTTGDLLATEKHETPVKPQEERFITFYTHSGFQNQLIQVENALMLAWYTNRTLLLPRALLGKPFGWSPLSQLQLEHLIHEKLANGMNTARCAALKSEIAQWALECPDPTTYTLMPYDELFAFDWAKKHIRIRMREEIDDAWMERELGVKKAGAQRTNGSYVDGDVRFFNGTTRYDWRIFDDPMDIRSQSKYEARLDVMELRSFPERLLHFGSLFGTGKMPIRDPLHFEFLRKLRRSLIYNHPVVLGSAGGVVGRMGGAGAFVGLHIRTGDGVFAKAQEENIHTIIHQLHRVNASAGQAVTPPSLPLTPTLAQCLKAVASHPTNLTLVYVATDARSPRSNPAFAALYAAYPCSFSLEDFFADSAIDWTALHTAENPYDGARLERYLTPMVDGTVAARARVVIGSKGSTFSGFIYQMHDVFWAERKAEQWLREEAEERMIRK